MSNLYFSPESAIFVSSDTGGSFTIISHTVVSLANASEVTN